MRIVISLIRIIVGGLFIFSGLVKANDPAGLSYKMHEFFEAWGLQNFNSWALVFSVLMIAFEIIAGLALLLGWYKKINLYLLLALIVFFTFLTGYALLAKNIDGSLKFKACGCFGDCIPLKPIQSFIKDIILLLLILLLVWKQKYVQPILSTKITLALMIIGIVFSFGIQKYTLDHLPIKDCLSFKLGNNILSKKEFIPDSVVTTYFFNKAGKEYSFSPPNYPQWYLDEDSTYVEDTLKTTNKVITVGNNGDIIRDFNLTTLAGNDTTEAILSQQQTVYLLLLTDIKEKEKYSWEKNFESLSKVAAFNTDSTNTNKPKLYIITNKTEAAHLFFKKYNVADDHILFCDEKPLLAAARTRPALIKTLKGTIQAKLSYKDWNKLITQ